MGKISIKKSDLDRIIKEEALKFKKALTLKKELKNIEEQLKQLNECGVNEVQAGADMESPGKPYEGTMKKAEFSTKNGNPHLKMEDNTEDIEDVDMDVDNDEDVDDGGKIDKAAVLSAIEDLKMALNLHGGDDTLDSEEGVENTEANGEEVGDGDEEYEFDGDSEEGTKGDGAEVADEEIDENKPAEGVQENLDEPMEGKSVVQNADEDNVNDNMKKDTHVKAATDSLMESEKKRMSVLAGIIKG